MTISKICSKLRCELLDNGYEYGFYLGGKRYTPDKSLGVDEEYFNLSKTIYRVQNPTDTKKEKIGTCIDTYVLMKEMLDNMSVNCQIRLIRHRERGSVHTIISFEAEERLVYLELTPESNKPWYGKEIIYSNADELISAFDEDGFDIYDVTNDIVIGEAPNFLLSRM